MMRYSKKRGSVACVPVLGEYVLELSPFGRSMRVNRLTTPDVLCVHAFMSAVSFWREIIEGDRSSR